MSARKGEKDGTGSLFVPAAKHERRSADGGYATDKYGKKIRPLSGPAAPQAIVLNTSDITRKGWMMLKEKKRYFALKSNDLYWWNEMPQDKFEISPSAMHNKTAGRIALGATMMVVRDGAAVNILTGSGDAYSVKCSTSDEAEEWSKTLTLVSSQLDLTKRNTKYGWVTYGEKKRILYLGDGKLDILDAHINLRRVIPLEARSVRNEGDVGFEVSSSWSVYTFECVNAKDRDSWVRKISLQIMRANTLYDNQAWERKGYLAMNKRKSCFFGLKSGKLYYYRSSKQGAGKRFVLADCSVKMVNSEDDPHIEITFKGVKHTLRSHQRSDLDAWFAALQGKAVVSAGAVLGAPLERFVQSSVYSRNGVPCIVLDIVAYLDQPSSFATEGLFHHQIDLQQIAPWIEAYNAGTSPNFAATSASFSAVASLLKHFMKSLPEPLIPESVQDDLLEHRSDSIELRRVVGRITQEARFILKPLFELLNNLAFESRLESNSAVELASVITPLVLWRKKRVEAADAEEEDLFLLKGVMAVGTLINRYDDIFEDVQPEVLALKKEVGADTFDQLLSQLAGATVVPPAASAKKPLPSLENWAKELRSAPARPLLPEAFLQAAAEKDREEGLDALAELENELETEKKERHDAVEAAGVIVVKPDPSLGDSSAIRAARPKKKKGVRITDDNAEQTKRRVQNATLMRTLRSSRKSRLTPEELSALKEKLDSQLAKDGLVMETKAKDSKFATEPRRTVPRNDTAIATLDDLFDELQKEKVAAPRSMLKRMTTSQRIIQARQSSNPKLQNIDLSKFLKEAGLSDERVQEYLPLLNLHGIDGSRMHLLTAGLLSEMGITADADRTAILDAAKKLLASPRPFAI